MNYREMKAELAKGSLKAKRPHWECEYVLLGDDGVPFLEYDDGERTGYDPTKFGDAYADDWKVVAK